MRINVANKHGCWPKKKKIILPLLNFVFTPPKKKKRERERRSEKTRVNKSDIH